MTNGGGRMGLTQRQGDCLAAIKGLAAGGRSPSLHEIAVKMGLSPKSKSTVYLHLIRLKERGYIDWLPNRARSIFLVATAELPTVPATTAAIALDLLAWLADELPRAREDAADSHEVAMNSYGAGYDCGFKDALERVLNFVNGERNA